MAISGPEGNTIKYTRPEVHETTQIWISLLPCLIFNFSGLTDLLLAAGSTIFLEWVSVRNCRHEIIFKVSRTFEAKNHKDGEAASDTQSLLTWTLEQANRTAYKTHSVLTGSRDWTLTDQGLTVGFTEDKTQRAFLWKSESCRPLLKQHAHVLTHHPVDVLSM